MQSVERQIRFSVKSDGVITCFLSLVLLLILALVSVSLESARVAGARFLTENYTRMAQESVMAEYSGALFDRYHIFAYNSRAGTAEGIRRSLAAKTEHYINRNLQAGNRMMWNPVLQDVSVGNYDLLTDKNGDVFRMEALKYMKYRGASLLIEKLLNSLGIFQGAQETVRLLETKAGTEEALAEIDVCILELFEAVDGFVRDEAGIKQNIWGKVKIKNNFVKKILTEKPTPQSAQINHPELFEAIHEHYVNPKNMFQYMSVCIRDCQEAQEKIELINQRLAELGTKDMLKNPELKLEQTVLETERIICFGEVVVAKQKYWGELRSLKSLVSGSQGAGKKALATIEVILEKQKLAESKVLQYETQLMDTVKWLDSSMYEELKEGLKIMKQYVGLEVEGEERVIDIESVKKTLMENDVVLSQMLRVIGETVDEDGEIENENKRIQELADLVSAYSHDGLAFDYSGMHLKAEGENPTQSLSNLLLGGIASLVLGDSASVSQAELVGIELPSRMINVMQTEKHFSNGSMNWMDATEFGVSSALATICKSSPFAEVTEWVVKEGGELTERVLFLSYLTEHFSNYVEQAEQESALLYEQEYLLCGDIKDSSNLYEVVGRVLLVREIFNLIHVISDGEKSGLAGEVALGLLGATGLPILVSVMKFLILFVWATEAALVETAALLQGKKVAVIPTGSSFPVSFSELLLMSGERIRQKAEGLSGQGGFSLGYSDYLMLFLLLQKEDVQIMRALDLIQENLMLEEAGFRVGQQVCCFSVQAEYLLPELFTSLPFSKRRTGGYRL